MKRFLVILELLCWCNTAFSASRINSSFYSSFSWNISLSKSKSQSSSVIRYWNRADITYMWIVACRTSVCSWSWIVVIVLVKLSLLPSFLKLLAYGFWFLDNLWTLGNEWRCDDDAVVDAGMVMRRMAVLLRAMKSITKIDLNEQQLYSNFIVFFKKINFWLF